MIKIKFVLMMLMMSYGSLSAADQRINYSLIPKNFNFKMYSLEPAKTDCTNLNRLVQAFKEKGCLGSNKSPMCDVILTQLKAENSIDRQNMERIGSFERGYLVKTFENLETPVDYSKRFDQGYADGYSFGLNDLREANQIEYQNKMSSEEIAIEDALQLKKELSLENKSESGGMALVFKSKIRVCALESGRLELVFTVPMSISTYHPVGNDAYDIAEEVYQSVVQISNRKNLNDNQKHFLLGMSAGKSLQKMKDKIKDSFELSEIALSLQKVVMKDVNNGFDPFELNSSSNISVALLDPGILIKDAKARIVFGGLWRD